ncbi:MAG: hypothetical protein LBB27_02805, partial [Tannerellaceae bacterium]|nr:hypothetical protein [Tannerellaceae bacterium]
MKKYLMIVIAALSAACSDDTPDVVLATTTPMTVEEFTPTSVTAFRKVIVQNVRDFYEDERKITFYFEDAKTCH